MRRYLVIRCGDLDGVNPVSEVDRVISERGTCWFGKYGQPISVPAKVQLSVVLVGSKEITPAGCGAQYRLRGSSHAPPVSGSPYPSYYERKMRQITTWLELEWLDARVIPTRSLRIKSSLRLLPGVLGESMRGHFWCIPA